MATGTELALAQRTPLAVAAWDQPSRLQLARSQAFELLANSATVEEVQAALTDEARALLPAALAGWEREAMPAAANDQAMEALVVELGKYIRLTGTQMSFDARQEWITGAAEELASFPASLVLPAIAEGRKREPWPNKLVPAICEKVEERAARLEAEGDRLRRLSELA